MSSSQTNNYCPAVITVVIGTAGAAYSAGTTTIAIAARGYGYKIANSFSIQGTFLGGASPANDLTLSVLTLSAYGGIATLAAAVGTSGPSSVGSYRLTLDFNNTYRLERDSSDITRSLRERLIYNEKRPGTNITGNSEPVSKQQGTAFRLAYLFGKMKCGAGFGGAFNLNGPNSFNSAGQQSGS